MVKDMTGQFAAPAPKITPPGAGPAQPMEELVGLELKQYLTSSDVLHQLMFSTVLLHWFIHKDGSGQKREMDFGVWKKLNAGIEANSTDVPEHVQQRVHTIVSKSFIMELAVATANGRPRGGVGGGPDEGGGHGPGDDGGGHVANERQRSPVLSASAAIEGWAQIVGGGFPKPSGLTGVQTVTYRHVSNIFSEVTNSSGMLKSTAGFPQGEGAVPGMPPGGQTAVKANMAPQEGVIPGPRRDDFTWLSICYTLLFFSASPMLGSPYAFVELQRVTISSVQQEKQIITLVGLPEREDEDADLAAAGGGPSINSMGELGRESSAGSTTSKGTSTPVTIVLLLPDGRWQELSLPQLSIRIPTAGELEMWSAHFTAASQGKVMRPSQPKSASPRQNATSAPPNTSGLRPAAATRQPPTA